MDVIPHSALRTLMEVGAVVGLFVLAMGCMACSLNGPRATEGRCISAIQNCWGRLMRRQNDEDDDDDSFIGDAETGRPAPHVFESLNDFVFFEAPEHGNDEGPGFFISTSVDSGDGDPIPETMDKIFPDILGAGGENTEADEEDGGDDLREPLL